MEGDLFSQVPQYTIDTSALIDIFGSEKMVSRIVTPGLWERLEVLINNGTVISHIEVLKEIRGEEVKGHDLFDWAQSHRTSFREYDWSAEGAVIRAMSKDFGPFVDAKEGAVHADPWLIAQATVRALTIITEERKGGVQELLHVSKAMGVRTVDLVGFAKQQRWAFK